MAALMKVAFAFSLLHPLVSAATGSSSGGGACGHMEHEATNLLQLSSALASRGVRDLDEQDEQPPEPVVLQQTNAQVKPQTGFMKWLGPDADAKKLAAGMIIDGDSLPVSKVWKKYESFGEDGGWAKYLPGADGGDGGSWQQWIPAGEIPQAPQGSSMLQANGGQAFPRMSGKQMEEAYFVNQQQQETAAIQREGLALQQMEAAAVAQETAMEGADEETQLANAQNAADAKAAATAAEAERVAKEEAKKAAAKKAAYVASRAVSGGAALNFDAQVEALRQKREEDESGSNDYSNGGNDYSNLESGNNVDLTDFF